MTDLKVTLSDLTETCELRFVVIAAMYKGKWIFARQKQRETYEIAGGHIEPGEDSMTAAKRELYEETGALKYELFPICVYNVIHADYVSSGAFYFARVTELGDLPAEYEIAERIFSDILPENLTYPQIQPKLFDWVNTWLNRNKTTVYFIRHAESDYSLGDERTRPLTAAGSEAAEGLTEKLSGLHIDRMFSSPFKRAVDTVTPLAASKGLAIETIEAFRERRIDSVWVDDFFAFCKKQWADFDYKLTDGECLKEVRKRNIAALTKILSAEKGKMIAIGTHGTALSTVISFYDPSFGYEDFVRLVPIMPYIMKMEFIDKCFLRMEEYNVL